MDKQLRKQILIKARPWEEAKEIGAGIHEQLKGNEDYINNNIILTMDEKRYEVIISIFKECKKIPKITI